MIGEFFAEIIGEFVKEFIFPPLVYLLGKPLVRFFSFGTLHTTLDVPHVGKRKKKPKSQSPQLGFAITFVRGRKRYLHPTFTALVGLVGWGVLITAIVVAVRGPG